MARFAVLEQRDTLFHKKFIHVKSKINIPIEPEPVECPSSK